MRMKAKKHKRRRSLRPERIGPTTILDRFDSRAAICNIDARLTDIERVIQTIGRAFMRTHTPATAEFDE